MHSELPAVPMPRPNNPFNPIAAKTRLRVNWTLALKNMSDNWLQLVPTDPLFRPRPEQAQRARELLASFVPGAVEVSAEAKDRIEFVDPGSNWSGVECPACGADAEGRGDGFSPRRRISQPVGV